MMDVRRLLNESLTNMRLIQRTSALSSRAREVLEKFIRILDSIRKSRNAISIFGKSFSTRQAKQYVHRTKRPSRLER